MKKRLQGLIAGLVIAGIITSGAAFGKQLAKNATVYYNNIKIFIDGGEITPKDANGNPTEAFIMDGTTYLPVRAIAGAFGQEVEWDGSTQSVYIGKKDQTKPDTYLHKIQYNDYKEGYESNDFAIINGSVTDCNENIYKSGIVFFRGYHESIIGNDSDGAQQMIAYPLNSQYSKLKGKIVLPKDIEINTWDKETNRTNSATDVWFYGDGKLLYKATAVTSSMPFDVDINVKGVNQLNIKIKTQGDYSYTALTDMALYK